LKAVVLVLIALICTALASSRPITLTAADGHRFIVASSDQKDIPMKWPRAARSCSKLGAGWRLPTLDELRAIYKAKDSIPGLTLDFASSLYLSGTTELSDDPSVEPSAWDLRLADGSDSIFPESVEEGRVRCVISRP
jgi:hypothetical protein